jgi:hypothetical protein
MKNSFTILFCIIVFLGCKKQSEEIQILSISDYAPLTIGKYITYSLDSLTFSNFGTVEKHSFYEVKYQIMDTFTDNLSRKVFRIVRYIRTLPNGNFVPDNTTMAVNTGRAFEFIENNIKYFKLAAPIADNSSWKGNSAISLIVNSSTGEDLSYLDDWDYTYENVGAAKKIGSFNLENTLTVNQVDDSTNLPILFLGPSVPDSLATQIASKYFSQEIYAKDIGMVYRNFLNYQYQRSKGSSVFKFIGYGVKLTMLDHN